MPVEDRNIWTEHSVKGIAEMLLNLNVPTGIILSGDGDLIPSTFTKKDLAKYEVVIFPAVFMLSDSEVEAVLGYVKEGGNVIVISDFATHDKRGNKVSWPELSSLSSEGEHVVGKGIWFTIKDKIGEEYYYDNTGKVYLPTDRSINDPQFTKFKNILFKYYTPEITTDAPITVNIRRYVDGDRVVFHLVNYNFDQTKDEFKSVGQFNITVTLPEGSNPSKAILYDFEKSQEEKLKMIVKKGKATISVPSLYAYSVIELQ